MLDEENLMGFGLEPAALYTSSLISKPVRDSCHGLRGDAPTVRPETFNYLPADLVHHLRPRKAVVERRPEGCQWFGLKERWFFT
jgi:hypothetical protein